MGVLAVDRPGSPDPQEGEEENEAGGFEEGGE